MRILNHTAGDGVRSLINLCSEIRSKVFVTNARDMITGIGT